MRDFKFRAWSISGKQMIGWEKMKEDRKLLYKYFEWDDVYHLMQYTGLNDRNGKEIYEGDILEYFSGLVAKGSNPIIRQVVKWEQYRYSIDNYKNSSVVGNVHENPELLEGSQC